MRREIRDLTDLCEFWCADAPRGLNRRVYKGTSCGASISLYLKGGYALHNGWSEATGEYEEVAPNQWERRTLPVNWDTVTPWEVVGFSIQTIVEGSDATVDSEVFTFPVPRKEIDDWVQYMEAEASRLWDEANRPEHECVKGVCDAPCRHAEEEA